MDITRNGFIDKKKRGKGGGKGGSLTSKALREFGRRPLFRRCNKILATLVKILQINNTIKKFSQVQLSTSHPLNLNQHTTQAAMVLSGIT